MNTIRAKLSCNAITTRRSQRTKAGLTYSTEKNGYVNEAGEIVPRGETTESWNQPTVTLNAVSSGASAEDNSFSAATPMATFELTITNPDAAEFFELGKQFYADFTPAN